MLAIAKPGDMLAGKLIGVGAVGLTQILIWVIAGAAILGSAFAAPILSGDIRRALPESAVLALIDVEFASHQFVLLGHRAPGL